MRRLCPVILLTSALVGNAGIALLHAEPVLDQFLVPVQNTGLVVQGNQQVGQTFRVGIGGTLSRIEVEVGHWPLFHDEDLLFEIRSVLQGGSIAETPLASGVIAASAVPVVSTTFPLTHTFIEGDLASANLMVYPGERLAIILVSDGSYAWRGNDFGGYGEGTGIVSVNGQYVPVNYDNGFRTFVTPGPFVAPAPEPATLVLLTAGSAMLLMCRIRR